MGIKTLFTQAFPQKLKDYYDAAINALKIDTTNTATGDDQVTLNTKSGVVTFTGSCEVAPLWREFIINNSFITSESIVRISVQSPSELGYASLVSVNCSTGYMTISINDGFTSNPINPIVIFEILG